MKNTKYISEVKIAGQAFKYYDLKRAARDNGFEIEQLPFSMRVLFENQLRFGGPAGMFSKWLKNKGQEAQAISYRPARVLLQDYTGVPVVVDLAAMRQAAGAMYGAASKISPVIPVDLVVDHSVQVHHSSSILSFAKNREKENKDNHERYSFLKWAQQAFDNFSIVPPGAGICHQVNLEYLRRVVCLDKSSNILYPDSIVGTDSHSTMINALGIVGWGVGGIEAESAMLGQQIDIMLPEIVGVRLRGNLRGVATPTDLILKITNMLRQEGVVGKFVEFFGTGAAELGVADRATISNMAPECGSTCSFFPVDAKSAEYLMQTGMKPDKIEIVQSYCKAAGLWQDGGAEPVYTKIIDLDLSTVTPSIAGPKRPQDLLTLGDAASNFRNNAPAMAKSSLYDQRAQVALKSGHKLTHGDLVIAAITSCTNTSNPSLMIGAALLARNAARLGLQTKDWVKKSFAPGSKVVTNYLQKAGLMQYLENLGFHLVAYGCTTCIGNSGPLSPEIEDAISKKDLIVASILSGNRNFEGRIHPSSAANYLASPPLVVAYALAGNILIDIENTPLGRTSAGDNIYLKDIWPSNAEVADIISKCISADIYNKEYSHVTDGDDYWRGIKIDKSPIYNWDKTSTYIRKPDFFDALIKDKNPTSALRDIKGAKILAWLGDSVTTDHISPAGFIQPDSPAGLYLKSKSVGVADFNSYGARRGNHEVMIRGCLANPRLSNRLASKQGGYTTSALTQKEGTIFEVAMEYKAAGLPCVIFAGENYGAGSSRDWAAKGVYFLGARAVIAKSFERIHRSNLIGMGILPITITDDVEITHAGEVNIKLGTTKQDEVLIELYLDGKLSAALKGKLEAYTSQEFDILRAGGIMQKTILE